MHGRQIEYQLKVLEAGQQEAPTQETRCLNGSLVIQKYIDDRPPEITNRQRVGDLEVDFIVSGKEGKGYCLTAADRRRYGSGFIRKVLPVSVGEALLRALQPRKLSAVFPEMRSISTDNDILWTLYHAKLEKLLGVPFLLLPSLQLLRRKEASRITTNRPESTSRKALTSHSTMMLTCRVVETKLNGRYMASTWRCQTPTEALVAHRRELSSEKCSASKLQLSFASVTLGGYECQLDKTSEPPSPGSTLSTREARRPMAAILPFWKNVLPAQPLVFRYLW